jgi:carboxypeptidase C (cathepsin A)
LAWSAVGLASLLLFSRIPAENGPYTLAHNMTLQDNPYGWDVNANMIFVDQPINTGFSWSNVRMREMQQLWQHSGKVNAGFLLQDR